MRLARPADAQAGGCRAIWGIRLGALLAANCMSTKDAKLALMLWQPVIDGKTHLTQFFRVRIAANMDRADVQKETTAFMRGIGRWQVGGGGRLRDPPRVGGRDRRSGLISRFRRPEHDFVAGKLQPRGT